MIVIIKINKKIRLRIVNREKLTVPSQVLMSSLVVDIPKESK